MTKAITTDHLRRLLDEARRWQNERSSISADLVSIQREYGLSEDGAGVLYVFRRLAEIAESEEEPS